MARIAPLVNTKAALYNDRRATVRGRLAANRDKNVTGVRSPLSALAADFACINFDTLPDP